MGLFLEDVGAFCKGFTVDTATAVYYLPGRITYRLLGATDSFEEVDPSFSVFARNGWGRSWEQSKAFGDSYLARVPIALLDAVGQPGIRTMDVLSQMLSGLYYQTGIPQLLYGISGGTFGEPATAREWGQLFGANILLVALPAAKFRQFNKSMPIQIARGNETYMLRASPVEHERLSHQTRLYGGSEWFLSNVAEGDVVLDVGFGTGDHAIMAARKVGSRGRVHGIDFEPLKVEFARNSALSEGVDNVFFDQGSVYKLPFAEGIFDLVQTRFLLRHLPDPEGALREIVRVLKPGGKVVVMETQPRSVLFKPRIPEYERVWNGWIKEAERRGGDQSCSDRLGGLMSQAGLVEVGVERIDINAMGGTPEFMACVENRARYFGENGTIKEIPGFSAAELNEAHARAMEFSTRQDGSYYEYFVRAVGRKMCPNDAG